VIDNLTTRDSLSYADITQRPMDIDTSEIDYNSALFVSKPSGNKKKGKKPSKSGNSNSSSSSSSPKTCTWCKKHNPGKSEGHTWNECFRLQKANKEEKEKEEKDKAEEANVTTEQKVRNKSFYFDTACTSHMTPYAGRLLNYSVCGGFVKSSSPKSMEIVGKGDVMMDSVLRDGSVSSFCVQGVLHVPDLAHPLISWRKLREKGYTEFGEGDYISVNKGTKVVFEAVFDGNLFKIPETSHSAHITYDFWHQALAHLAPSTMDKSLQLYSDADIPDRPTNYVCSSCIKSKMTRSPRTSTSRKVRKKLDLVHSDLSGPFPVSSYGNSLYFITLVDDATRVGWVRFMKQTSETTKIVKDFVAEIELQHHKTPAAFRTDNGGEYVTKDLKGFFTSKGIIHEFSPPYSPESNGVAERLNRTIGESLRAMLESAVTYDKKLWAEAVLTAVYIKNRQSHSALNDLTPYEALYSTKPSIQHIQPFGRECYIHVPYQKRTDGKKSSPRAQRAIFPGYTNVPHHYRVFLPDTKKTIVSADTFFPPLEIEGATPTTTLRIDQILTPLQSNTPSTSVEYTYNNKGKTSDNMWRQWMDESAQEANDLVDNGHEIIARLMRIDILEGKKDGYLGAPYWVYDGNNSAYQEGLPQQPEQLNERVVIEELERIEEFDESIRTVVPADHFLNNEHQQSDQRSQLPLGRPSPAPPRPMTPSPIPFGQVVTRARRVVNPPERYGFEGYAPEASMWDAPPRPPALEPQPLEGIEGSQWAKISVLTVEEPKSYGQAKVSRQWSDWKKAMDEELKSLKENDVWDVILKPAGRKIVASRWVYKAKGNAQGEVERYKARLVAKGFSQILGQDYDEIFAPMVRYDSLRLLLALSACKGWRPRQLDVKTAFVYGILKEEVYMDIPEGSRLDGIVAKLKRCIDGLKQSPREWYYWLVEYLGPIGFAITAWDPCVLVHESGDLFLAMYVDDITLFGATGELKEQTINVLKTEFKVNDMGELNWHLGIQITFTDNGITLSLTTFIDKILNRFSMQDCKPVSTPIDSNHQLKAINDEQ